MRNFLERAPDVLLELRTGSEIERDTKNSFSSGEVLLQLFGQSDREALRLCRL
jgi:hypothetical protein